MRVKIISVLIALFSILILTNVTLAGEFNAIYTTDSEGSFTRKNSFGWNETPWLYLGLPDPGLNVTGAWWQDPLNAYYFTGSESSNSQNIWLTLTNWNDVKKAGPWSVNAIYFYANNPTNPLGSGSTTFTVTPEPISSFLFITGAGILALRHYRKKGKRLL